MNSQRWSVIRNPVLPVLIILLAAVVNACASDPSHVSPSGKATGELVIGRSFALAGLPVALVIDGQRSSTIPFNRKHHMAVAAGWHTLSVRQIPMSTRTGSVNMRLLVEAGKTYKLTATKVGQELVLQQKRS